ncbi:hypothetical protein TALK_05265 [Thalassospira alkalitolerans]|uniref:Uncharacterized protein n=1 Tax=Thalassospira alkalitolerans TaxID=1293890 RepID=A0A1Y2LFI2_9PROT|nr:hypothetical protein TALK_05265 [Thalassospira alkalitolerans]
MLPPSPFCGWFFGMVAGAGDGASIGPCTAFFVLLLVRAGGWMPDVRRVRLCLGDNLLDPSGEILKGARNGD